MVVSGKDADKNIDLESRLVRAISVINGSKQQASSANAKAGSIRKQAVLLRSKTYLARAKVVELKESLEAEASYISKKSEDRLKEITSALVLEPKASAASQMRTLSRKIFRKPEKN